MSFWILCPHSCTHLVGASKQGCWKDGNKIGFVTGVGECMCMYMSVCVCVSM